jgi:hypothetical protein
MPEVQIRERGVKPLLDTQLTFACGERRAQIGEHAHIAHRAREEFIQIAL